jgi:hypothetical protein
LQHLEERRTGSLRKVRSGIDERRDLGWAHGLLKSRQAGQGARARCLL